MTYSGFYTTADLTKRYKIASRTLNRWVNREKNPFPKPTIPSDGGTNRWSYEIVEEWEKKMGKLQTSPTI